MYALHCSPLRGANDADIDMCALTSLVTAAPQNRISVLKGTDDLNKISLCRSLLDIDPFCDTTVYTDHESPLACGHDASRRNEQDGLIAADGPLYSRIHSGRKPTIRI